MIDETDLTVYANKGAEESVPLVSEKHKSGGKYIKSIIYGGLDGIVSVFVAVAAVNGTHGSGSSQSASKAVLLVLALGIAKLLAGAISMGLGDWLSTAAEVDMAKLERRREEWETDNFIEGEVAEMIEIYEKKGVSKENATRIMELLSKNKQAFVDIMMAEELGIPCDLVDEVPYKHGLVNFFSFMGFGSVPLVVYVIGAAAQVNHSSDLFYISIAATAFTLVLMGVVKARVTGSSVIRSPAETLLLGGFTAVVGWGVGYGLQSAFPGASAM